MFSLKRAVLGVVLLVTAVRADAQTVTVRPLSGPDLAASAQGAPAATGTSFYNNTNRVGLYFAPVEAPGPAEFADDVPFTGSHLVTGFSFAYYGPIREAVDIEIRFYNRLGDISEPVGPALFTYRIAGLPTDPQTVFVVDVDLKTPEDQSFLFTAAPFDDGMDGGYVSLKFSRKEVGWMLASGNVPASRDKFYALDPLSPGEDVGFYDFGGPPNPEASFYLRLDE